MRISDWSSDVCSSDLSGALVAARDAATLPTVVKGYNLLYPLHAAKVGGLAFRLVMTLAGLAMTLLGTLAVWTFWFRRPARAARPRQIAIRADRKSTRLNSSH